MVCGAQEMRPIEIVWAYPLDELRKSAKISIEDQDNRDL